MNEQLIGDLFAEATRRMTGSSSKEFSQKFAELIVRECINQCAHAPDVSEDWYQGVKWVANEIAQHFGVEE